MKYLLIPIEEISKEIKNQVSKIPKYIEDIEDSYIKGECEYVIHLLQNLQSKGEIVEIENNLQQYYDNMENSSEGKEYNAWKFTRLKEGYTFCDFLKDYHNKKGYKLIKTVK